MTGNGYDLSRRQAAKHRCPLRRKFLLPVCLWFLSLAAGTLPGWAEQISSSQELYAALSRAQGGETFLLAPGDYGKLELTAKSKFNTVFAAPVTITSADPGRPASFTSFRIQNSVNIVLDRLVFDYTFDLDHPMSVRLFSVKASDHITIRNSVFDGDVARGMSAKDDGFGYGYGLELSGGSDVRIENNKIFQFNRGIVTGGTQNLRITGNDVHSIRSDGMNFVQVSNVLIENNYLHDFIRSHSSGDHSDMIQFWTNGSKFPSTGITIRGNVLLSGNGDSTQSIFMRNDLVDRGLAKEEMFYRDVRIEQNVIVNGHLHGITLGESDGVMIRQNTLLRNHRVVNAETRDKMVTIPRISVASASRHVEITDNIGSAFPGPKPGWTVKGNLEAQDITTMHPGYYHKLFINAQTGDPRRVDTFVVRTGSAADRPGLGAPILRADP